MFTHLDTKIYVILVGDIKIDQTGKVGVKRGLGLYNGKMVFDNSAILAFDHLPRATPVRHTRHGNSQFEQCLTKTHLNKSEVPARQKQSTLLKKAGSPKPSKTLENTTQKFWIN